MGLMRIRLELGRVPEFPEGSGRHGYEFLAPLTSTGHIDVEGWRAAKGKCTVVRFWGDDPEERGLLRHLGHSWRFDYPGRSVSDDEPFFKLDEHKIECGGYVSVTEHDGVRRPFKIVSIEPALDIQESVSQ
jgi:hypothetical protein